MMDLQNHDLDPQAGTVLIRRTWTRYRLGPTKTGRERTVSFLHPVIEDSGEWRPAGSGVDLLARLRVRSTDPASYVLVRPNGQPWDSKALNAAWQRLLAKAHVRYRSPEQLRHSFASIMLSRNAPLLYVQRCGGRASATVLLDVYAQWRMPQDGAHAPATGSTATTKAPGLTIAGSRRTLLH
jgi:integrase